MNLEDTEENPEFSEEELDNSDAIDAEFTEIKKSSVYTRAEKDDPIVDEFASFLSELTDESNITFVVWRKSDKNLAGKFRIPCEISFYCDSIYWNKEQSPEEVYDQVAKKHGGGRYSFQVRSGKGFQKTWTVVIGDPAQPSERERTMRGEREQSEPERTKENSQTFAQPQPTTPPPDPLDTIIGQAQKMNALREALFPPSQQTETTVAEPARRSVRDEMLLTLTGQAKDDPNLRSLIINAIFDTPKDDAEKEDKSFSFTDLAKYAFENPEKVSQLFGGILSTLLPAMPQTPAASPMPNFQTPATGLQAFKVPRNEPTPATEEKTQPEAPQTASIVPKFISLED